MSLKAKVLGGSIVVFMTAVTLFAVFDDHFRLRDRASLVGAYRSPGDTPAERDKAKAAVRYRIGQLLRPDETVGVLSGDPNARWIEIGNLYGRLAMLEERDGNVAARDRYLADAVRFLRRGGIRDVTEQSVRQEQGQHHGAQ